MKTLRDLLLIAGIVSFAYGLYLGVTAWHPLGWIAGGTIAAATAIAWRWVEVLRQRKSDLENIRKRGE